jgi:hypothetical protein
MPTLFESEEYQEADNFYKQALIKDVHSKSKKAAYADLIGQEFDESLGAYEFAENSATRINDKAKEVFENKVISLNFGEPLLRDYFTEE